MHFTQILILNLRTRENTAKTPNQVVILICNMIYIFLILTVMAKYLLNGKSRLYSNGNTIKYQ